MRNGEKEPRRIKILVVDDDSRIRNFVRLRLESEGYEVTQAANGEQGLERLTLDAPDLVLLDLSMPVMDGWEMLKRLRAFSQLPVIILSANNGNKNIQKGLELGADEYVTKPFVPDELIGRIKAVLRRANPSEIKTV